MSHNMGKRGAIHWSIFFEMLKEILLYVLTSDPLSPLYISKFIVYIPSVCVKRDQSLFNKLTYSFILNTFLDHLDTNTLELSFCLASHVMRQLQTSLHTNLLTKKILQYNEIFFYWTVLESHTIFTFSKEKKSNHNLEATQLFLTYFVLFSYIKISYSGIFLFIYQAIGLNQFNCTNIQLLHPWTE